MIRKFFLALTLVAALALSASPLFAQNVQSMDEKQITEAFAKESPLTAKDIDSFIAVAPKLKNASADPAAFKALLDENGLTEIRYAFVTSKVSMGVALAMGSPKESFAQVPAVMMPTDEELELIKPRQMEITQAMMAMGQ